MSGGRKGAAWVIAACTSWAAASMLRERSNWSVICVEPSAFAEFIAARPAMVENWRSSGVATEEAIVSGLAPGLDARTRMVGKSTLGRSLTGSVRYAPAPNRSTAAITSQALGARIVPSQDHLGRLTGSEIFRAGATRTPAGCRRSRPR